MNKLRATDLSMQQVLNNYLLTVTYRFGNIYTAKTFSFNSHMALLVEYDKLLLKYPYLVRKSLNVIEPRINAENSMDKQPQTKKRYSRYHH